MALLLNRLVEAEVVFKYAAIFILSVAAVKWLTTPSKDSKASTNMAEEEKEEVPDPPRNFTCDQLRKFNGAGDDEELYISVDGTVFDVSTARDFYGPGGPYGAFAGRECGVALAKMSFDESHLDDLAGCAKLNAGEKHELETWIDKFKNYRQYPVVGRLVPKDKLPSAERIVSPEELSRNNGSGDIPEGYAAAPIFVGVGETVFDVSFGGVTFYGPGCSYNRFAGKNAGRALAKMSFEPEDIENSSIADLTDSQKKVLNDWIKKFKDVKMYPCVGRLEN